MKKNTKIKDRLQAISLYEAVAEPKFPLKIMAELSNRCNHACIFCAHRHMQRPKIDMSLEVYERVLRDSYTCGAREVGLHMGAEPFASRHLERCVELAKSTGYTYVYLSTNGSLATPERMTKVIAAGIDSIKFSINGGNRYAYRDVHGVDHFEKVLDHVRHSDEIRKQMGKDVYLSISFIECPANVGSYEDLLANFEQHVDEVGHFPMRNQSGQVPLSGGGAKRSTCHVPFSAAHISAEGYLRVCCNDYHNYTAIADLTKTSIGDAWNGPEFVAFRKRFLTGMLAGTLCHNCLRNEHAQVFPLNKLLSPYGMI